MTSALRRQEIISLLLSHSSAGANSLLIDGREAAKRIARFLNDSGLTASEARAAFSKPAEFLGEFGDLPPLLRRVFSLSALFHDQEHLLTNLGSARRWLLMPVWRLGNLLCTAASRLHPPGRDVSFGRARLARIGLGFGRLFTTRALERARKIVNAIRFTRFYQQPFLTALFCYLGIDVKEFIYSYVDAVPACPVLGHVFRNRKRQIECGIIAGIDFLPARGALYYIEANFNPGFRCERLALYQNGDPIFTSIIQYCKSQDYKNVIIHGSSEFGSAFDQGTATLWKEMAEKEDISLQVVDYLFGRHLHGRPVRLEIDVPFPAKSLIVLARPPVSSALSKLVSEKGNLEKLIEKFNQGCRTDDRILLPPQFFDSEQPVLHGKDSRFPNIIVKDRRKDCGTGILLFNTDKVPDGYATSQFLCSEYIAPDCYKRSVAGRCEEFVRDFRALILLTASGPVYLGTYVRRSGRPVPDTLDKGRVADVTPYIANISRGGAYEKASEAEEALCRRSSLALGQLMFEFLSQKSIMDIGELAPPLDVDLGVYGVIPGI